MVRVLGEMGYFNYQLDRRLCQCEDVYCECISCLFWKKGETQGFFKLIDSCPFEKPNSKMHFKLLLNSAFCWGCLRVYDSTDIFLGRTTLLCSIALWSMAAYSYFLQISGCACPDTTPWLVLQQCLGVHWYSGPDQLSMHHCMASSIGHWNKSNFIPSS